MLMHIHSGCIIHEHTNGMYFKKNIWAELSYEFGPNCLINLGRIGMGRVLCGPSWFWAELSVIRLLITTLTVLRARQRKDLPTMKTRPLY